MPLHLPGPMFYWKVVLCDVKLFFCLREGTRQAEMLAFPFAAAREPAKLAERVLYGCRFFEMSLDCVYVMCYHFDIFIQKVKYK